ncbi:MAG: DNA gyrase subunit A [Alphaproteobacteria bacterium CG_4_10_14_0_8_um_filter_53_9]|nr:MAG: DNA gyrase subunit A [Alphaproteobacteria bacterium CG_4_10_14_0_8_um_filter_53_9]
MDNLFAPTIKPITIEDEMQKSYLDYAMSVIVSRALPDVRDGLKPVHRRILYAQNQMSNDWNRKYLKSARVVGDVMGKYHPHGDSSIYMAMARMAQDFSMRLPLEDGQGNFGSMDGDNPAAMRYTEIRLSRPGSAMLQDIEEGTVDFRPNYDGSEKEPAVLPTRIPNLLVNGSGGIAVGMATNIPPHNLGEVINGILYLIDNPEQLAEEAAFSLREIILGPDFPTGGTIMGGAGILGGHQAGRGSVVIRGKAVIEQKGETRNHIIITEIPYQVNKSKLVEQIADLVKEKKVEDISDLRDESDRHGVRVVVELKRGANAEVVLNQLYKNTQLQTSFSYNMVVLDKGLPRLMGIPQVLRCFIAHREDVVNRRTRHRLSKARDRAHILVGLGISVANIDEVIALIRNAPDGATAKDKLMAREWPSEAVLPLLELLGEASQGATYKLSAVQAQAILDLRLQRLTGLERDKIMDETKEIAEVIAGLLKILSDRPTLLNLIKEELIEVRDLFATPRKTNIEAGGSDMSLEDLIQPEDMVVTISSDGYVKRVPLAAFRAQRRGGKGKAAANLRDNEQMSSLFAANTHDPLLFFTNMGNVFKLKCYELPQASATTRGKAFVNLLPLQKDETVAAVIPTPRDEKAWAEYFLIFGTQNGAVRKTPLTAYANVRSSGIYGMGLNDGDRLLGVHLYHEPTGADVIMSSQNGQAVRFSAQSDQLRPIASRTSTGVRGMSLKNKDQVMAIHLVTPAESHILTVTANGYGKLTDAPDYPTKGRGTMGVISIKTSSRNGNVVAALPVSLEDQIMLATSDGQLIRMNVADISVMGRNTQGVKLFGTDGSKVTLVTRLSADMLGRGDEEDDGEDDGIIQPMLAEAPEAMPEGDTPEGEPTPEA